MFLKIKRIVFIGGNRFKENGPLLSFVDVCINSKIDCVVISDKDRSLYPTSTLGNFSEALEIKKVDLLSIDNLSIDILENYEDDKTLIFCVNCKWILSSKMIDMFPKRVFNYHNAALPEQRGAGCHSWRLMQGINFTRLTIHEVSPEIDKGKIFLQDEIEFDKSICNLAQSYQLISSREVDLFSRFLKGDINIVSQDESNSFYWPKLSTELNGFIDWSWSAQEIVSFCNAFDEPFGGSSTFLKGIKVQFSNVLVVNEDYNFHPFQAGLIYRISDSGVFVATRQGGVCIKELKSDKKINIREGLRFITPPNVLLLALSDSVPLIS